MSAKRMRRKICPKPSGKYAYESQLLQPFRKPDRRFNYRHWFKIRNSGIECTSLESYFWTQIVTIKKMKMVYLCVHLQPSGYKNHMKIHSKVRFQQDKLKTTKSSKIKVLWVFDMSSDLIIDVNFVQILWFSTENDHP